MVYPPNFDAKFSSILPIFHMALLARWTPCEASGCSGRSHPTSPGEPRCTWNAMELALLWVTPLRSEAWNPSTLRGPNFGGEKAHNLWPLKWKYDWNMTHDNLYRIQWCHHVKHSQNWLNEHLNVVYDVHDFRCSGYQGVDPCPCTCSDGNLNLLSRNCAPSNMSN